MAGQRRTDPKLLGIDAREQLFSSSRYILAAQRSEARHLLRECLFACLAVCHICESYLNRSRYQDMFCIVPLKNDVYS